MSLKDFHIHREEVTFVGGTMLLRGLALNDISYLVSGYLPELEKLFKMYDSEEQRATALQESVKFATTVVRESPLLVAQLIALACDEPDQTEVAGKLPLPVQVEAIRKIFEITFIEAGGAKNFVDNMVALVKANRPKASEG